jgi:malonyl-CoA decarboxylase
MLSSEGQPGGSSLLRGDCEETQVPKSADAAQSLSAKRQSTSIGKRPDALRAIECFEALISPRGEVSGASLANKAVAAYQALNSRSLSAFFDFLVNECSPNVENVRRCGDAYREQPSYANLIRLQQAVESPRQELFRRLNLAHNGTAALVEIRRCLLRGLKDHPAWAAIEADLANLLRAWFNGGFLELRRIDRRTPTTVLEKLMKYEAVHRMRGWQDLRRRLEADRRCFALFHPTLVDEPLVFMELALTSELSSTVEPLLDENSPVRDASMSTCAIFYSISSCHEGLKGIPFGNALIRRVVQQLKTELPRLKVFATLSPVPGFRPWLTAIARDQAQTSSDLVALATTLEQPDWFEDAVRVVELKKALVPLCAFYLLQAKRGQEPADPVARFHLGNGARLTRLNWFGDPSDNGIQRCAGLTANYVYRLSELERNHGAYASHHTVMASRRLYGLARNAESEILKGTSA